MEDKKPLSFVQKMKLKVQSQKTYGIDENNAFKEAKMDAADCPNCGAGRAKQEGLTHCAYCGHEFLAVKLTDGIFIKKEDNSNS
ncbi:hypothetical protein B0A77_05445 [Flavobacterium branchiophilum]|uniref:Uncharacterized protein n=2 Tax=Flavobacterium branchiophilum TaxID=55197 RepID=A0A2H3KJP4_9FLAO|nr:hypothetical protein B0A77_05445 [Flavobacterium branchiophilum]